MLQKMLQMEQRGKSLRLYVQKMCTYQQLLRLNEMKQLNAIYELCSFLNPRLQLIVDRKSRILKKK